MVSPPRRLPRLTAPAGQASNFAWANSLTRDDEMLRSVTLFSMNLFSNLWNLWYQIVAWPVVDAPRFTNGQIATIVTGGASIFIAAAIVYCSRKYRPDLPQDHADAEYSERGMHTPTEEKERVIDHPVAPITQKY